MHSPAFAAAYIDDWAHVTASGREECGLDMRPTEPNQFANRAWLARACCEKNQAGQDFHPGSWQPTPIGF